MLLRGQQLEHISAGCYLNQYQSGTGHNSTTCSENVRINLDQKLNTGVKFLNFRNSLDALAQFTCKISRHFLN